MEDPGVACRTQHWAPINNNLDDRWPRLLVSAAVSAQLQFVASSWRVESMTPPLPLAVMGSVTGSVTGAVMVPCAGTPRQISVLEGAMS